SRRGRACDAREGRGALRGTTRGARDGCVSGVARWSLWTGAPSPCELCRAVSAQNRSLDGRREARIGPVARENQALDRGLGAGTHALGRGGGPHRGASLLVHARLEQTRRTHRGEGLEKLRLRLARDDVDVAFRVRECGAPHGAHTEPPLARLAAI